MSARRLRAPAIRGAQASNNTLIVALTAAAAACYAIGYPLALIAHSNIGWAFVFLGGPLLVAVGFLLIRRASR